MPGPVAQSVENLISDPWAVSLILAPRPHTFQEIDHEIFSVVILLLPLIQVGKQTSVQEVLVNHLGKLAQEKCCLVI